MSNKELVLQNCTVDGLVVKLPAGQLDAKLYKEVAKSLTDIGGKWVGRKTMGFVFALDPTDRLIQISSGVKRNIKTEYQFFATQPELADDLVKLAGIPSEIPWYSMFLEPSAGNGAIIDAIHRKHPELKIFACELMEENRLILSKKPNVYLMNQPDFLEFAKVDGDRFDYIIANPPFSKNQDIDHLQAMYKLLRPNGRVVCIISRHYVDTKNKKELEFKQWLLDVNAVTKEVPAGAFKKSGTTIATQIVIIHKPTRS